MRLRLRWRCQISRLDRGQNRCRVRPVPAAPGPNPRQPRRGGVGRDVDAVRHPVISQWRVNAVQRVARSRNPSPPPGDLVATPGREHEHQGRRIIPRRQLLDLPARGRRGYSLGVADITTARAPVDPLEYLVSRIRVVERQSWPRRVRRVSVWRGEIANDRSELAELLDDDFYRTGDGRTARATRERPRRPSDSSTRRRSSSNPRR